MTHRPNPAKLNEALRELSRADKIEGNKLIEIAGDQQRAALLLHHLKKRRLVELPNLGAASGEDGLPESLSISRKGRIVLTAGGYAVGCSGEQAAAPGKACCYAPD